MASALTLTLLFVPVALALWLYWVRCRFWSRRLKGIQTIGVALPLIGNLYQFFGAKRGLVEKLLEVGAEALKTRKPLSFWMGEIPSLALFRPEDFEVLLSGTRTITKPDLVYKPVRDVFGNGLITLNGDDWQHHRKVLTPVFHFKILEQYVGVFKKHADALVKELFSAEVKSVQVDAMPFMARVVSNTICETAFGMSETLIDQAEVRKKEDFFAALNTSFLTINKRIFKPWLMIKPLYRWSSVYAKQQKAEVVIREYTTRIIRMKKAEIALDDAENIPLEDDTGAKKKVAFLDLVLRDAKDLLSEDEIFQEVRTLVAVQQTTASTLSFIFVMLAIHQDVQKELFREIRQLDDHSVGRSYLERLSEMKYLERVIKETMRLFPVTPLVSRVMQQDVDVPGCTIPANCVCFLHVFVMQRDKRFYGPDPEKFDPGHFLPERCRTRHPYAYIPFSAGPRNCIGQKYAMLQMKAIVSTVVSKVRIFPGTGCQSIKDIHLDADTFLHIVGGFNVRFEPRHS